MTMYLGGRPGPPAGPPPSREMVPVLGMDEVVVVTNGEPITEHEVPGAVVLHDKGDVNISRWWNQGLDWIEQEEQGRDHRCS